VTVLAERAWNVEDLDQSIIASELQAAEAELASASSDTGRLAAVSAVEQLRALQR
jgi:F0F1-type ATP synthase epsilon subunit